MTPIPGAFSCSKAYDRQELKEPHSWISQLRFEHLKTVTVYFWTLQRPSDPVFLNLSRVSCMFGRGDIKRVTFMLAGGRYVNSQLVRTECLESSRQDTYWEKLQGVCRKDQLENNLETVPLQARSEEYWKHSCRWLLFEQLLFVPKHVTLSQKMPLVLLVSIPLALLTSSEVLPCSHGADMSLAMSENSQLFPVRDSRLLEQNVLKTVGRKHII